MTYKQWGKVFVDGNKSGVKEATKKPMEKTENKRYTKRKKEEFEAVANDVKPEITNYTSNSSKWSGKININNDLEKDDISGQKEWNCAISIIETADDGTVWHEMLHSCSASYYAPDVYAQNQFIEEASVEFLKQQICSEKEITHSQAYTNLVSVLQAINDRFHYGTDMEFAKELFNIPLPDRYQWFEDKVIDSLKAKNASFEDFNDVLLFIQMLKGGSQ